MATEQTYLSVIHDAFAAAATAVNEQLVDRGLAPLKSWLTGEPTEFRQSDTPYGCWDFENLAEIGERRDELNVEDFQIDVIVTLALAGKDRSDLTRQIATVPPNVIAALECLPGSDLPYDIQSLGVHPMDRGDQNRMLRLVCLPFRITGQRAVGGVS